MSAADKIEAARALIEPLTGHTPGPFGLYIAETPSTEDAKAELARLVDGTVGFTGRVVQVATFDGLAIAVTGCGPMGEVNGRIMAAAPALRDTVAALADLADAQAQEIARLRAGPYVKPLEWRDLTYGMQPHWTANHSFGSIDIRQEGEDLEWRWVVRPFIGGRSNWPTLEEAKADAEADYRARVRAALGDAQ